MNAISNVNAIHIVRCSWCNRLGHEQTNCPSWIGCIAHEREKQLRLKEMQAESDPLISDDGLAAMRGLASGLLMSLAIWILVGYLVLR
jgi:hypothetical protein